MWFFLVILAFCQFQGYEQTPDGANFSPQFRAPPEVFGMRQMSNDQVDSIKSDRINYFQDDQIPMRLQEVPSAGRPTQNMYQSLPSQQQFENAQSRVISPDAAQDYTDFQRSQDYSTQGGYQQMADNYNVANQKYGPSPKNYQQQQMSLDIPTNYQTSEHGPVSAAIPGVRPGYMTAQTDYRVNNEIPQSSAAYRGFEPQMTPQNYQAYRNNEQYQPNYNAVNQDDQQDYTQASWAGPQQNHQGYQLVNKNADEGMITITLPDNEDAAQRGYNNQRQGQQQPQFINGYQVINEGPVEHIVSGIAPGSTIIQSPLQNPPQSPANYNSAANVNPQDGYMPVQSAFYPPQVASNLAGGQYVRQSQNEVYAPYMGGQDQQREGQYEMWKPQQPPMPMPMPMPMPVPMPIGMQMPFSYLSGSKGAQDNLMNMISSQLVRRARGIACKLPRF